MTCLDFELSGRVGEQGGFRALCACSICKFVCFVLACVCFVLLTVARDSADDGKTRCCYFGFGQHAAGAGTLCAVGGVTETSACCLLLAASRGCTRNVVVTASADSCANAAVLYICGRRTCFFFINDWNTAMLGAYE